jgi:hypothetical protein
MSRVIEACVISSSRGGVEGNRIGAVGGLFDGGVAGIVVEGGIADDGVAVTGRGERISLLSSSKFRSNSTSFRLRLVRFAGGDWNPGVVVAVGQEAAMKEPAVLKHRWQQRLAGMTAPDLQPQRWRYVCAFAYGDASRLQCSTRRELAGCKRR